MEINIPEVVLIPRGHLLQEEDPEENSRIPGGTVQISVVVWRRGYVRGRRGDCHQKQPLHYNAYNIN